MRTHLVTMPSKSKLNVKLILVIYSYKLTLQSGVWVYLRLIQSDFGVSRAFCAKRVVKRPVTSSSQNEASFKQSRDSRLWPLRVAA